MRLIRLDREIQTYFTVARLNEQLLGFLIPTCFTSGFSSFRISGFFQIFNEGVRRSRHRRRSQHGRQRPHGQVLVGQGVRRSEQSLSQQPGTVYFIANSLLLIALQVQ